MTSESPLLWLEEKNTDVWEMVMIELVKTRMKYVMDDFKELCDSWGTANYATDSELVIPYPHLHMIIPGQIHSGRIIIRIIQGGYQNRIVPIKYESKYFVYGFYLQSSTYGFYLQPSTIKMELHTHHRVVNVLDELSRLNNFEFDRTDDNATIHDLVKFLYEREEQMVNDKHIYCMVKNEIIP